MGYREFSGIFIGIGDGHLQLAIERLLAERKRISGFGGDPRGERLNCFGEAFRLDHVVDESNPERELRVVS